MDLGPIFLTNDTSVYGRDMAMSLTTPAIPSLQLLCVDCLMQQLLLQNDDESLTDTLQSILYFRLPGDVRERIILLLARKKRLTKDLFDMLSGLDVQRLSFNGADLSSCADQNLLEDVWEISAGIESFDFSGCEISTSVFRMLITANIQSPPTVKRVLHLNFSDCDMLTDYLISVMSNCFSNLITLQISNCPLLTAETLSHITNAVFVHSLTSLDVSYNAASPSALSGLSSLCALRSLHIAFMKDTGNAQVCLEDAMQLEQLDLSALHELEDESIEYLLIGRSDSLTSAEHIARGWEGEEGKLPLVQRLHDLRLTESYVSSDSFQRIFSRRMHVQDMSLVTLDLSWCENITASALTAAVTMCPLLQTLLLRSTKADNTTVTAASENCPHLMELNVSRCDGINDVSLTGLTALTNLQSLDLSWASIQNLSTVLFLECCTCLRVLSVQGCKGLEVDVIDALLAGAAPRLKFIDLGWVNMFSSALATELSTQRPDLIVVGAYNV